MPEKGRPRRPAGLRRRLYRLPRWLFRARLGFLLGHRVTLIEHVGRTTGQPRDVVVEVVEHDPDTGTLLVASGFGAEADWYRNLLAHPKATVHLGRRRFPVRVSRLREVEAAEAMVRYARRHPHTAPRIAAFLGDPVDGSDDGYRAVGRRLPMLRLVPVPPPGRSGLTAPPRQRAAALGHRYCPVLPRSMARPGAAPSPSLPATRVRM